MITHRLSTTADPDTRAALTELLGHVAIANAKLAYQKYLALCRTDGWQSLAAKGARPQRLLWASTSSKNASYRDVRYVEELIGPDTVTTLTLATMDAFRQHGRLRASLEEDLERAHRVIETLQRLDISLSEIADKLLDDGVALFSSAFERLLASVRHATSSPGERAESLR